MTKEEKELIERGKMLVMHAIEEKLTLEGIPILNQKQQTDNNDDENTRSSEEDKESRSTKKNNNGIKISKTIEERPLAGQSLEERVVEDGIRRLRQRQLDKRLGRIISPTDRDHRRIMYDEITKGVENTDELAKGTEAHSLIYKLPVNHRLQKLRNTSPRIEIEDDLREIIIEKSDILDDPYLLYGFIDNDICKLLYNQNNRAIHRTIPPEETKGYKIHGLHECNINSNERLLYTVAFNVETNHCVLIIIIILLLLKHNEDKKNKQKYKKNPSETEFKNINDRLNRYRDIYTIERGYEYV
jgi:hypothetical protein